MPEGIVQKFDVTVHVREGGGVSEFKGAKGYRVLPGWISLIAADGVEHLFASGETAGCAFKVEVRPVSPPQIVTPGGNGVLRG